VDLDALAGAYRFRPASDAARQRAQRAAAGVEAGEWALDVGGGPGEHAELWSRRGLHPVVLDPSGSMLAAARGRTGVATVQGRSQRMPFADGVFRLVYFHLSLHYGDWRRAVDEAMRVLTPGGTCWVWTLGPDHHASSLLAQWFPSVESLDRRRFPDPDEVAAHLERSGDVSRGREIERRQRPSGEWRAAVAAGFVSTLQLVDPAELAAGLDAFAKAHPDPRELVTYEMRWDWIRVDRQPLA
jgi:SAM-dependent methyltransferase